MSTKDFLTNVLGFPVRELRPGMLVATTTREKFASAIDELVNARGLAVVEEDENSGLEGIGLALSFVFATDQQTTPPGFGLNALLHDDTSQTWLLLSTQVPGSEPVYPAITRRVMVAHWYERQIFDLFGIEATGHPDLQTLVWRGDKLPENFPMQKEERELQGAVPVVESAPTVSGEGIYEMTLGPVQAGIAESFEVRASVAGERAITLEMRMHYGHKGVEKFLEGKSPAQALPKVERIAGDAGVAHALAFVQAAENLSECEPTSRALGLRTLFSELERVSTHVRDIGSVGGVGTGYTVLATQSFRLVEKLARLSDELFGNRFWRGQIVLGGVARDLNANELQRISNVVSEVVEELHDVVTLAMASDGWRDRLETTGVLSREAALAYGAVGLVARASGIDRDVRRDHPYAAYEKFAPRVLVKPIGDVFARFCLRVEELKESVRLIQALCQSPGEGRPTVECEIKDGISWSATEGARGETLYFVEIKGGMLQRIVIRDPSFCNWPLMHELAVGNLLSDLPLCILSLGLSAAGTDL